jgi:hypothetical protein
MRSVAGLGAIATCVACGTGSIDLGRDAGSFDASEQPFDAGVPILVDRARVAAPEPPNPPASPILTPCPVGWRTVSSTTGPAICDPWPDGQEPSCGPAELSVPGSSSCISVGAPCTTSTFALDLPRGRSILYVNPRAPAGGNGSLASPYSTIQDATLRALPGVIIAAAAGRYTEPVALSNGVGLYGVCAAKTVIVTTDSTRPAIRVTGADAYIHSVTVSGLRFGIEIADGGGAVVDGVIANAATGRGFYVHGSGTATASAILIRDTKNDPADSDQGDGFGFMAENGGHASIRQAFIEHNIKAGLIANGPGAKIVISDSIVRDTELDPTGALGIGFLVQGGGAAQVSRTLIERSRYLGAMVSEATSSLSIEDSILRATRPDRADGFGGGAAAVESGHLIARRCLIEDNVIGGVYGINLGTVVELSDLVVRHTRNPTQAQPLLGDYGVGVYAGHAALTATRIHLESNTFAAIALQQGIGRLQDITGIKTGSALNLAAGMGMYLTRSSSVTLDRALFSANRAYGIALTEDARLSASDITVLDTQIEESIGETGRGIQVDSGARLRLKRALLERNIGLGLMVISRTASLTATDLTIRNTLPETAKSFRGFGVGMSVQDSGIASVTRVAIDQSRGWGIYANTAQLSLADARISRTLPVEREPFGGDLLVGRGIDLGEYVTAHVVRSIFEDNRDSAISIWGSGTTVFLSDVIGRDTTSGTVSRKGGSGLYVGPGAHVVVEGARFERNREISVFVNGQDNSSLEMRDIDVVDTLESACVEDTCPLEAGGIGVGVYDTAIVDIDQFLVWRSALCGVQIAHGGLLSLHRGAVFTAPIGANVQDPGYDFSRLSDNVVYIDNDRTLDATALVAPKADPDIMLQ